MRDIMDGAAYKEMVDKVQGQISMRLEIVFPLSPNVAFFLQTLPSVIQYCVPFFCRLPYLLM